MPAYKQHIVLHIAQGLEAFVRFEVGAKRSPAPGAGERTEAKPVSRDSAQGEQRKEIEALRKRLAEREREVEELRAELPAHDEGEQVKSESLIWIFGTARVGSTWLVAMMEDMREHSVWHEPLVGSLFGNFYNDKASEAHRRSKQFILGRDRQMWLDSIGAFVLEGATARFPELGPDGNLIVKEPNGSIGAPLMMEALPESRLIFMLRDPRDVVASVLDASRRGGWNYERPQQAEWKRKALADNDPDLFVKMRANNYMQQIGASRQAYEAHQGPKVLVRYEDLVADTLGEMRRIHSSLGVSVDEEELAEVVEKHSWVNIPEDKKGEGKFYRKGASGGWREDLTPEQARAVEEKAATILEEFYPD